MSATPMTTKRLCFRLNGQAIAFPLGSVPEDEARHRLALLRSANVPLDPDGVRHFLRTGQFPPPKLADDPPTSWDTHEPVKQWTLRQILHWYLEQPGTLDKEQKAISAQDRPHSYNLRRSLAKFAGVIDLDRPPPLSPADFHRFVNARRFDRKHQTGGRSPDPDTLRKEVGDVRALYNHWAANEKEPLVSRLVLDYGEKEEGDHFRPMTEVMAAVERHPLTDEQARKLWHTSFPTVPEAVELLAHIRRAGGPPWLPAITAWACYTGCRASEARRALVAHWERERGAWIAYEKKAKKGKVTKRLVPILKEVEEYMADWLLVRPIHSPYLFCRVMATRQAGKAWAVGDKLGGDQIRNALDRALAGSKWENFPGLHRFRHGLRSNARNKRGVKEEVISDGVGHSTTAMAERYSHSVLKSLKENYRRVFADECSEDDERMSE